MTAWFNVCAYDNASPRDYKHMRDTAKLGPRHSQRLLQTKEVHEFLFIVLLHLSLICFEMFSSVFYAPINKTYQCKGVAIHARHPSTGPRLQALLRRAARVTGVAGTVEEGPFSRGWSAKMGWLLGCIDSTSTVKVSSGFVLLPAPDREGLSLEGVGGKGLLGSSSVS